jgi:UDP-N-acetylmuramoyl-tripeptide--D-alanyl-D-alanine ligase
MRTKVIGVAGSNGKTSTKHIVHHVLGARLTGTASPKSFNNDIGVPLTLFPADPMQDYIVLEMGTNHHGEIRVLTEMAQPDIAVITNCGADHLEFLDDLMGVRRENATIIDGLNPRGLLIVNGDDEELLTADSEYRGQRVTFGFNPTNDLFATDIECVESGVHFKLNGRRDVYVPLLGKHTACNALAAIAVARKMGLSESDIIATLASTRGPEMRLQVQKIGGITLINDAYNANPNSVRAALETVKMLPCRGRRVAVLGDMLELGRSNDRYHKEIGQFAAECRVDALVCVGANAELMANAAERAGLPGGSVTRHADSESAARKITKWITDGDLVLIKGSRGVRLESVADAIAAHAAKKTRKLAS